MATPPFVQAGTIQRYKNPMIKEISGLILFSVISFSLFKLLLKTQVKVVRVEEKLHRQILELRWEFMQLNMRLIEVQSIIRLLNDGANIDIEKQIAAYREIKDERESVINEMKDKNVETEIDLLKCLETDESKIKAEKLRQDHTEELRVRLGKLKEETLALKAKREENEKLSERVAEINRKK